MQACSQHINRKIKENDNLESFMVDLYTDTKNIGCNIRLLGECLTEWQNTNLEIQDALNGVVVPDQEFAFKL